MLQGEATATVVVVDLDSVVSVVDLEEDLGEVKAAEVDSDSGEETAAAKAREAPADLDSAARVEVDYCRLPWQSEMNEGHEGWHCFRLIGGKSDISDIQTIKGIRCFYAPQRTVRDGV